MKHDLFFLVNSLNVERGGLTLASLRQSFFFKESGYNTHHVTFNLNVQYPSIIKKLREQGKLHHEVIFHNFFDSICNRTHLYGMTPKKFDLTAVSGQRLIEQRTGHNAYRVFNNGQYEQYISLNKDGSLHFIDYFNENRHRTKRELFDTQGVLYATQYMDLLENKPRQMICYNEKGEAKLSQWFDPKSGKIERTILFTAHAVSQLNPERSHRVNWLEQITSSSDSPVLISDARPTDLVLLDADITNAFKVLRLHSNHLSEPYTFDAAYNKDVAPTMNRIHEYDAVTFLTNEQKSDVEQRLGSSEKFHHVPHAYEMEEQGLFNKLFSKEERELNRVVMISRYVPLKRVTHAVQAFQTVVEKVPAATLEIYGKGDDEKAIAKLVSSLGLSKNVSINSYTTDVNAVYKKAAFSLLTSTKEGFPLVLFEAMANGTPMISYDLKYGPTDMIRHGENGMLVENGNIEQLADTMIELLTDPDKLKSISKEAKRTIAHEYNKEKYREKWLKALTPLQK